MAKHGFKEGFSNKVDSVNKRAKSSYNVTKEKLSSSHLGIASQTASNMFKAKGKEAKLNALNDGFGKSKDKIKNGRRYMAMMKKKAKLAENIKKKIEFIKANLPLIKTIVIVLVIIIVLSNLGIYAVGVIQAADTSPHYYCDLDPDPEVKSSALYKQYCLKASGDNESIAAAAVSLATADLSLGHKRIDYTTDGFSDLYQHASSNPVQNFCSIVPNIIKINQSRPSTTPVGTSTWWFGTEGLQASCDWDVCLAVWWSGADDNFPSCLGAGDYDNANAKSHQVAYLKNGTANGALKGKWIRVDQGAEVLPGDIAYNWPDGDSGHHVWMYVAHWTPDGGWIDNSIVQERFPGSRSNRYEGSHEDYYPRLVEQPTSPWSNPTDAIFRFVGEVDENSIFKGVEP